MKRANRKTVKTTRKAPRAKKNGQVTQLQVAKAVEGLELKFERRLKVLEEFQVQNEKTLQHIMASDFMANHAAFRKQMADLEEGMPGISMSE